jgi:hypothetical protein
MPKAICEDCGSLVEAELTHNGVCQVGHYVHCGWGHQLSPDDLISDAAAIEILTEQLEAARADAKEAEAYAEELEKQCEGLMQAGMNNGQALIIAEAKLAAAVDWFETIRDRAKGDYMAHTYYLDALAALATIERSNAP